MSNLKYLFLFLIVGCSSTQQRPLYSIGSKATCKGPNREYHTALHATKDGYFRFHQSYYDGNPDYDAVAFSDSLGFTLAADSLGARLEAAEISVGKGHSFHMIAHQPQLVFNYSDEKYFDAIGNEVKFKFDPESKRVESFQITNPFDSTEKIDIYYSQWEDVQGFMFPMHVQIIQGGKDEYFFEFYEVKVNDPSFSKIPAP
ncbi:DUF4292 domain-containing protein [Reichenbachiella sp.]|uniref:DUF4292 domain-containing protein n=1 Tax=Reichenbachiella sp. TaxID=2184521 RepID=UPI003B59B41E